MDFKEVLKHLSEAGGVSGQEGPVRYIASDALGKYADDVRVDTFGNIVALKRATIQRTNESPRVMLAAHYDEIGLIVTKIEERGFLRFSTVGGVDPRTLPGQEVVVQGREPFVGIIGAKPPHVQSPGESKNVIKLEELFIDIGLSEDEAKKFIKVGDLVNFKRDFVELSDNMVAGKSMDDRAGLVVILKALKELSMLNHQVDVYAVATVQEEVGVRGATVSTYGITPDIGIAIDVTHGHMEGVSKRDTVQMGGGSAISIGPHVHPKLFQSFVDISREVNIPYQIEASPTPAGTDAFAIQITREGVASALISIPLRYMHTSVEVASMDDIKEAGRLIAAFIARIDQQYVEELKCF